MSWLISFTNLVNRVCRIRNSRKSPSTSRRNFYKSSNKKRSRSVLSKQGSKLDKIHKIYDRPSSKSKNKTLLKNKRVKTVRKRSKSNKKSILRSKSTKNNHSLYNREDSEDELITSARPIVRFRKAEITPEPRKWYVSGIDINIDSEDNRSGSVHLQGKILCNLKT